MLEDTWVEFTACIEKQIEANDRAIEQLAETGAIPGRPEGPQKLIDRLKGNSIQLRALAERSRAKAVR